MRSDDARATILLASRIASDGVKPLKASELASLVERIGSPGRLLGPDGDDLLDGRLRSLLDRSTAIAFELDRLDQTGIATLTPYDEGYPQSWRDRLGAGAPPVIHAAGPLGLFDRPLAFSAEAPAPDVVEEIVRLGAAVLTNHAVALGGATVTVLADPLLQAVRRPDIRKAVLAGQALLCTPYAPDARATEASRKGRDRLIEALAACTVDATTRPEDLAALLS